MAKPEARDIMTDGVIAVGKDESVQSAARKMRDEDISGLVVVDGDEAVGVIVARDVVYKLVSEDADASEIPVSQIMSAELITASVHDDVSEIARAMLENGISRVPVLEGDSRLVGIITKTDIMRAWPGYVDLLEEKAASGLSQM